MRLADFIETNSELILTEWVTFARMSGPAAESMDPTALRDHALQMLQTIVADLRTPQTAAEQLDKSRGQADGNDGGPDTAAEVHGAGRAGSGFTVGEMVSEYRAFRATIIRLWTRTNGSLTGTDLEDLTRFNEAVDQALAESITRYTFDVDRAKDMFLAILGHDLRSPLGAVQMASQFMLELGELQEPNLTLTTRIVRSTKRMNQMVGDLLDFTRSRLGSGVPIARAPMDMGKAVKDAADEILAANPDSVLQVETTGDLRGNWDPARISQVITNLLGNAVQHGSARTTITISAKGEATSVVLRVRNRSPVIAASELPGIFGPFKRLRPGQPTDGGASNSLGLGLYIAERIVTAHGGTIEVESSEEIGTAFTVRLPR